MTILSYHSTFIGDIASPQEAAGTTSCQIILSRAVAGPASESASSPSADKSTCITSVFESGTRHVMIWGKAGDRTDSGGSDDDINAQDTDSLIRKEATEIDTFSSNNDTSFTSKTAKPKSISLLTNNPISTDSASITGLPRTTEPKTMYSANSFPTMALIDKERGKGVDRGRTTERCSRLPNPLARAESRSRRNSTAIEVDARPLRKRPRRSSTFHDNPSDLCALLDDNLLEPCPHIPVCAAVSEVLNSPFRSTSIADELSRINSSFSLTSNTSSSSTGSPTPAFTTLLSTCRPLYPAPTFPPEELEQLQVDISHLEYLAIKSSSQKWSTSRNDPSQLQEAPKDLVSSASQLPTEILHQIFNHLGPVDFNAARHTCRSWFISSLDRSLLETMLRRGGFCTSIRQNTAANYVLDRQRVNDEWLISKRLARECALGPDWTGNGLPVPSGVSGWSEKSAFVHASSVDFAEIAVHCPTMNTTDTIFYVSCCGRFLVAANGCLVYLYELNQHHTVTDNIRDKHPGYLRPITSIICPRRVLACSMDTSSQRYAIAILLDGRMGLVCDIAVLNQSCPSHNVQHVSQGSHRALTAAHTPAHLSPIESFRGTSFLDHITLNSSGEHLATGQLPINVPFVFPGIATTASTIAPAKSSWQDEFEADVLKSTDNVAPSSQYSSLSHLNLLRSGGRRQSVLLSHDHTSVAGSSIPIEMGARSLYQNLCSDDDPPRSVAICPQRRCVAFGCSSGIELHWVDALTGQDLNRWFPLTSPSDFLFFLPPRRSVDSAKKLRLICSAAKPNERPAIGYRAFGGKARNSPFWRRFRRGSDASEEGAGPQGREDLITTRDSNTLPRSYNDRFDYSDHYRAIPLSDGYHILFTDPTTGLLCMGSDAPVGGPTKLLRKMWFEGPEGDSSPVVYAGGADLSWGVRVVAAFGTGDEQNVWLFSVPRDIFAADQDQHLSDGPSWPSDPDQKTDNLEWVEWWPDEAMQDYLNREHGPISEIRPRSVWPLKVKGQKLGRCDGVVDLAVDSGAHMIIWAFSKEGIAKVWKLDDGRHDATVLLSVARDGTIRQHDADADVEMVDVALPSPSPPSRRGSLPLGQSFDGSSSFISTASSSLTTRRRRVSRRSVQRDSQGDVLMEDLPSPTDTLNEEPVSPSDRVTVTAGPLGEVQYLSRRLLAVERGVDFIEELTGMARVDIEIH